MPITLRIQNDTGRIENANSYIDEVWFQEYAAESGYDVEGTFDDEDDQKVHLVRAFRYLNTRFNYKGEMTAYDQSSAFPRYNLTDRNGYLISGVPLAVKQAQAEYAWLSKTLDGGLNPTPTRDASGARVTQVSERVGPISESKSFASGGAYEMPEYPVPDGILRAAGFIVTGGTIIRG